MTELADSEHQLETAQGRLNRVRNMHEIGFALNIVCALVFAFLAYLAHNRNGNVPRDNLEYCLRRSVLRVADLLPGGATPGVLTEQAMRHRPSIAIQLGRNLTILPSALALSMLLLLVVRLIAGTRMYGLVMNHFALLTSLFALPGGYLAVMVLTWAWRLGTPDESPFVLQPLVAVFVAEILCVGILFIFVRTYALSFATIAGLAFFHYVFWTGLLWPIVSIHDILQNLALYLFLLVFVASGLGWLLHYKQALQNPPLGKASRGKRKSTMIVAGVGAVVLFLLWFPGWGYSLAQPKDINTFKLVLERESCSGGCPSYSITIYGSGLVEYSGHNQVRIKGGQTGNVSRETVAALLQDLDRIHFSSLEDRAFDWCSGTPVAAVSIAVDGRSKRVASDMICTGAKPGPQDQFAALAQRIDAITGSGRWVKCDGRCP